MILGARIGGGVKNISRMNKGFNGGGVSFGNVKEM